MAGRPTGFLGRGAFQSCRLFVGIIDTMTDTQPLISAVLVLALIGLIRAKPGKSFRLLTASWLGLLLISWPPAAWLFSRPLEVWYPVRALPNAPAQAIVVLSDNVEPPHSERPYPLPGKETYRRCAFAAWLHRHWQPVPVLACGGHDRPGDPPFSATMRNLLKAACVPEDLVWTEERSGSTYENALFGAEILRRHGIYSIALVVDAQSMPRAEACFRKQGLVVVPAPSSFNELDPHDLIPSWKAIEKNEITLHETLGLLWYRLRGWI
jgi:uncharacterized SAM-binding protein YcdF (DUF218 family)